jgi:hypothetical protein
LSKQIKEISESYIIQPLFIIPILPKISKNGKKVLLKNTKPITLKN